MAFRADRRPDATDAYGPDGTTLEAIERAGQVGDLEVLDLNYPFSTPTSRSTRSSEALGAAGSSVGITPAHLHARVHSGRVTNPDPAARAAALEVCDEAVGVAQQLGAPTVELWPGQDGFDYPFQADYRELWKLGSTACARSPAMDPDIHVAIEYKPGSRGRT